MTAPTRYDDELTEDDPSIAFSVGRNINDAEPVRRSAKSIAALVKSLHKNRAASKATAGYVCGPLSGKRCAENVLPRRWIALDMDRIDPDVLPDLRMALARFSGCGWPTHSSTDAAPRERAIIELNRAVTRAEGIEIGRALTETLRLRFGDAVYVDPSTFRGEQPVFLPPVGVTLARFAGDAISVEACLREAAALPAEAPAMTPEGDGKVRTNRNEHLSREAFRLRKRGQSVEQVEAILQAMNSATCSPPLAPGEVADIAARKRNVTPDPAANNIDAAAPAAGAGKRLVQAKPARANLDNFYAYMPSHTYFYVPTRELWPAASVNSRVAWPMEGGKMIAPSKWLDEHRAVEQVTWHPGKAEIIVDTVVLVAGWVPHIGARVFNLYLAPLRRVGDATMAGPWVDHVRRIYPDDAEHIIRWLAHRVQHPGVKVNHALVLGGQQGIGKDTILEPVTSALGKWNCQEISPAQMLGRFSGWMKAVLVRVSEARDLGDVDRYAFYEHSKAIIVTPPDVLRVDEKNLREHYVVNVLGLVITTNHKSDGLYLPADDRRHYVAWSDIQVGDYAPGYWPELYAWYASGGTANVGAYLNSLDLAGFDPKAPPAKTAAFWAMVQAGEAPESGELRDVLDHLNNPPAVTLESLVKAAYELKLSDLHEELRDRKNRRAIPHKLERVDYIAVRNPDATDGMFKVLGMRRAVYARRMLPLAEQIRAARRVG